MPALLFLSISLLFLSSCAATTPTSGDKPVFFPPAPAPPRIQYLTSFENSQDVEGDAAEIKLFAVGAPQTEALRAFSKPYGITARGTRLYVADSIAGKVAAIDLRLKTFVWLKGDFGPGKLGKPINLSTDAEGNLYVADTKRKKVLAYDAAGNFLQSYGDGYDMKPVDVAADEHRLYVLDMSRHKILVFNKRDGQLLEGFGQDSENPRERLRLATNMALTEQGIFYVANAGTGSIIMLDRDGHTLGAFGGMGDGLGQFARPKGVASDSKKRLYVVDAAFQNVQLFDEEQKLLMFFGAPGLPRGSLRVPAGIAVTDRDIDFYQQLAAPGFKLEQVILVVSQLGPHKVTVYGLGKQEGIDYETYYLESLEKARKAASDSPEKTE